MVVRRHGTTRKGGATFHENAPLLSSANGITDADQTNDALDESAQGLLSGDCPRKLGAICRSATRTSRHDHCPHPGRSGTTTQAKSAASFCPSERGPTRLFRPPSTNRRLRNSNCQYHVQNLWDALLVFLKERKTSPLVVAVTAWVKDQ